jgi:hypothetical protein
MQENTVRLCRDENCDRLDLHFAHDEIEHTDEPLVLVYWLEWGRARKMIRVARSRNQPWRKPAPKALDHSIAKAVSKTYPKPFNVILRDVKDDYGDCNRRTVERRLRQLVARGHCLRIDLGRRLFAYLRPGSSLVNDHELMREQLEDLVVQ